MQSKKSCHNIYVLRAGSLSGINARLIGCLTQHKSRGRQAFNLTLVAIIGVPSVFREKVTLFAPFRRVSVFQIRFIDFNSPEIGWCFYFQHCVFFLILGSGVFQQKHQAELLIVLKYREGELKNFPGNWLYSKPIIISII